MDCDKTAANLELYVLGELPPDQNESIRDHLDACPACQAELERAKELLTGLDQALGTPSAREEFGKEMFGRVKRVVRVRRPSRLRWAVFTATAAATILIGLALAFWLDSLLPPTQSGPTDSRVADRFTATSQPASPQSQWSSNITRDDLVELQRQADEAVERRRRIQERVKEEQVGELLDKAESLMARHQYAQASIAAEKATEIDPDNADAMVISKLATQLRRVERVQRFDDWKKNQHFEAMQDVWESGVLNPDEPPMAFPNAQHWWDIPRRASNGLAGYQSGFGTRHEGGAFFAFVDGQVRFISENIDFRTYRHLLTASGREVVDDSDYGDDDDDGKQTVAGTQPGAGKDPATQPGTWRRSKLAPNASRLSVGDNDELPLKAMQLNVRIDGFRARVVIDCFYMNDRDKRLEGNFQLRLPNGASPFFYAFGSTALAAPAVPDKEWVGQADKHRFDPEGILTDRATKWEKPKEARMVPRQKAAFAYGEVVRRRVDPALAEWAGAGLFNARVFPLEPKKLHRIVIGYDVDLVPVGDDLQCRIDLPGKVPSSTIAVGVASVPGVEVTVTPEAKPTRVKDRQVYTFVTPKERILTVRLTKPGATMLVGSDSKTGPYFAGTFQPELPDTPAEATASHAVLMLDTSLSSNPDRFNIWLKLARALLDKNRTTIKQFAVLLFNVETHWWRSDFTPNTPENVEALLAYAKTLSLEGATDLGAALREVATPGLIITGIPPKMPFDVFLLSDGAVTWGEGSPLAFARSLKSPLVGSLFAYRTGMAGTDIRMLAYLAATSGGAVFSVVGEDEIAKAATAHRSRPWVLEKAEIAGGSDVLVAGRPRMLYPGQRLLVVGRGTPEAGAKVALTLRQGNYRTVVRTAFAGQLQSELAPRAYGQVAVGQLEDFGEATAIYAKSYASHFRVTGRTCSLLMLETEEDYKQYDIKPEEDAFVVSLRPAGPIVAKHAKELKQSPVTQKQSFLGWLARLQQAPGLQFRVPTALRMALEAMPEEAFDVTPAPLACKQRTWKGVPGNLQEQLAARKLEYDAVSAEAARRLKAFGPHDALKALSSLVESKPGDGVVARDVAFSAMGWGLGGQAVHLFRRVAFTRPFEPQTYQALARCLEQMGRADLAMAYYEVALTGKWNERFGEFRRILGIDYLRFLRRVVDGELTSSVPAYAKLRLKTVAGEFALEKADLLVTVAWNTDSTDVDLHVTEPGGEECYYKHPQTKQGAKLTKDVTGGYGPEMYLLGKAAPGEYRIRVKYFASDQNRTRTRTKVYVTIYEGWGTKHQSVMRKVLTLPNEQKMHEVAVVKVGS